MGRRLLDIAVAAAGLVVALPVILLAGIGIKLTSSGPMFYRAQRVGLNGKRFEMLKLRTMLPAATGASIATANDARVFPLGRWLRLAKIDELPQLWNILRGEMALVGPRPEDPSIVAEYYGVIEHATLAVRPGLTSPGTLFYYSQGEAMLDPDDPVGSYVARVMRPKLALDAAYAQHATLRHDLLIVARTIKLIVSKVAGRRGAARRTAARGVPDERK
jgi:lipopolysaccharide/colanic/teichoic acid biosynthesis glycosyltransferase